VQFYVGIVLKMALEDGGFQCAKEPLQFHEFKDDANIVSG